MTSITDPRPLLLAAIMTALVMLGSVWSGVSAPSLSVPDIGFGNGPDAATSTTPDELPLYAAYLPACDVGSTSPSCPADMPVAAPVIGRISPAFGRADGWLEPGGVDRFQLTELDGTLTAHVEGDLGTHLGVYAAGVALQDPAAGLASVENLALPSGVGVVQLVVVNPTDASREYRLVLD